MGADQAISQLIYGPAGIIARREGEDGSGATGHEASALDMLGQGGGQAGDPADELLVFLGGQGPPGQAIEGHRVGPEGSEMLGDDGRGDFLQVHAPRMPA